MDMVEDAFLDEIYQAIKRGQDVTLKGFGGFFVRSERESLGIQVKLLPEMVSTVWLVFDA